MKINILGSCVSRVAMLGGDTKGHGIAGQAYMQVVIEEMGEM